MLISPSEPALLHTLGKRSIVPEKFGADILTSINGQLLGIQRKTIDDYVSSLEDGRLTKQIQQLRRLSGRVLILEGRPNFTRDGLMMQYKTRFSFSQLNRSLLSIQAEGVMILQTENLKQTHDVIKDVRAWYEKPSHIALSSRPAAQAAWGRATNREWCAFVVQSVHGIGPRLAERIVEYFSGLPLAWTCARDDLLDVDGLGPVLADRLYNAFRVEEGS